MDYETFLLLTPSQAREAARLSTDTGLLRSMTLHSYVDVDAALAFNSATPTGALSAIAGRLSGTWDDIRHTVTRLVMNPNLSGPDFLMLVNTYGDNPHASAAHSRARSIKALLALTSSDSNVLTAFAGHGDPHYDEMLARNPSSSEQDLEAVHARAASATPPELTTLVALARNPSTGIIVLMRLNRDFEYQSGLPEMARTVTLGDVLKERPDLLDKLESMERFPPEFEEWNGVVKLWLVELLF